MPAEPGKYQLAAELSGADGQPVRSLRDFRVASPGIAVGCRATASLTYGGCSAQLAIDGDPNTHWSSEFSDPQWLAVDLGKFTKINGVELEWDPAFGKAYVIQISPDGKNWTDVYKTTAGRGNTETIRFAPVDARWVPLLRHQARHAVGTLPLGVPRVSSRYARQAGLINAQALVSVSCNKTKKSPAKRGAGGPGTIRLGANGGAAGREVLLRSPREAWPVGG